MEQLSKSSKSPSWISRYFTVLNAIGAPLTEGPPARGFGFWLATKNLERLNHWKSDSGNLEKLLKVWCFAASAKEACGNTYKTLRKCERPFWGFFFFLGNYFISRFQDLEQIISMIQWFKMWMDEWKKRGMKEWKTIIIFNND